MEFNIKHFLFMSQFFIFVSGYAANGFFNATVFDTKTIILGITLVIGLLGTYVSLKAFNLLFSRNYKKVK